jgi:hypothetical protein
MYTNGLNGFTDVIGQIFQAAPSVITAIRQPAPIYSGPYNPAAVVPGAVPGYPLPVAAPSTGVFDNPLMLLGLGALGLLAIGAIGGRRRGRS